MYIVQGGKIQYVQRTVLDTLYCCPDMTLESRISHGTFFKVEKKITYKVQEIKCHILDIGEV